MAHNPTWKPKASVFDVLEMRPKNPPKNKKLS